MVASSFSLYIVFSFRLNCELERIGFFANGSNFKRTDRILNERIEF
jgi:hypothetical protein